MDAFDDGVVAFDENVIKDLVITAKIQDNSGIGVANLGTSGLARLYRNGQEVASANLGTFTPNTASDLLLGKRTSPPGINYTGVLDEMSLYNRSLSSNEIAAIYNAYKKSGDLTGTQPSAFLSLVPFVENTGDYTVLAAHASSTLPTSAGPSSTDQVSCISCHRTHASPFPHKLRWFPDHEFITRDGVYPGPDDGGPTFGRTAADWQAAYYDRPATVFATSNVLVVGSYFLVLLRSIWKTVVG